MPKKKDAELTLIQCTVGAKKRIKANAKKKGVLLYRMMDDAINRYLWEGKPDGSKSKIY